MAYSIDATTVMAETTEELSEEKQQKLNEFKVITDQIADTQLLRLLKSNQWDLQRSVDQWFENGGVIPEWQFTDMTGDGFSRNTIEINSNNNNKKKDTIVEYVPPMEVGPDRTDPEIISQITAFWIREMEIHQFPIDLNSIISLYCAKEWHFTQYGLTMPSADGLSISNKKNEWCTIPFLEPMSELSQKQISKVLLRILTTNETEWAHCAVVTVPASFREYEQTTNGTEYSNECCAIWQDGDYFAFGSNSSSEKVRFQFQLNTVITIILDCANAILYIYDEKYLQKQLMSSKNAPTDDPTHNQTGDSVDAANQTRNSIDDGNADNDGNNADNDADNDGNEKKSDDRNKALDSKRNKDIFDDLWDVKSKMDKQTLKHVRWNYSDVLEGRRHIHSFGIANVPPNNRLGFSWLNCRLQIVEQQCKYKYHKK